MIRVLVGCEHSGRVREAFRNRGADAWSCDILPADDDSPYHIQGDVLDHLAGWDIGIFHPPCTHLAVSGALHFRYKRPLQEQALRFVRLLMDAPIECIAVENPVSVISSRIRKPDQIIQPYQFGHPEQKQTCLWLKNLPLLEETNNVYLQMMSLPRNQRERIHFAPPGPDRSAMRSLTYPGIAEAMADQWLKPFPIQLCIEELS